MYWYFSSYLDLPFFASHILMSRLVICLYFHWHPLFPNISVFSCCNLFALLLFLSVYLFPLRSVKQILFTHSLCIICLCHTLCSVIFFFHSLCYDCHHPGQHSFKSPISLKIIFHDNGHFHMGKMPSGKHYGAELSPSKLCLFTF